jgi:diguanylate cyclase (GGDEF)-like protein
MTDRRPEPSHSRPGRRLGDRLTKALVTTAGAALLVAGLIFDAFVYLSLRDAMIDDLTVQARIVAENSSAAILFNDHSVASQTLSGLQAAPAILHAELRDEQGHLVGSYGTAQPAHAAGTPAAGHVFAGRRVWLSEPVHEGGRRVGTVEIVATLDPLYRRIAMHVAITALASVIAFAFAFVLVLRIRRDIDATESRLDYLAHYDPVTGLLNRHAANEQIERLIAAVGDGGEGFALMLLDLDDFKSVNDTLGHAVGDQLLRALAGRLAGCLGPAEAAFRFGGDEFVILAPGVSGGEQLQQLGQQAMSALRHPIVVAGHEVRTRASIGIARFPGDAGDAAALVRAADTAMYDAKAQGKNTCSIFRADMERASRARMRLETDLRHAIARGELRLLYQPIVDLKQHRMVGVEALLRWLHPEFGLVPPSEFIAVAESSGLIVDIGQWVLHTACRQARAWREAGFGGLHVAVNVSARQIRRGLHAQVEEALAATGGDPGSLEIEITEHSMVEDIESNVAELAALGELGIQVAVDDFGTGLSSLAYLKRLPINKLKIDRTFVKDLPQDADDAAIARAIVSMARSLGLTVVAEGVETEAQRDFLSAQGCDCAQGFLYSRPVDADAITELLQRHRRLGPVWPAPAGGRTPLRLA